MAKTRIYTLGKELGVNNPDIMSFLKEKGVDVKSPSSSVEDDVADLVRKKFGGSAGDKGDNRNVNDRPDKDAQKAGERNSNESGKNPVTGSQETAKGDAGQKKAEKPSEGKKQADPENNDRSDDPAKDKSGKNGKDRSGKGSDAKNRQPQKASQGSANRGNDNGQKKKKIIMVSNPNNSQANRAQQGSFTQGRRQNAPSYFGGQGQHQFIRPKTKPTRVSGTADLDERIRLQKERKDAERAKIKEEERKKEEAAIAAKAAEAARTEEKKREEKAAAEAKARGSEQRPAGG
ncbi:MAG: translation initiation factor IF-2 N-terminal domain-containing protein, partial [Lachnospiraceae bacterium]|nr:translation initiation factor IF-2 N-terminal domain-containing protein [Lachnospiraceae bacterium]